MCKIFENYVANMAMMHNHEGRTNLRNIASVTEGEILATNIRVAFFTGPLISSYIINNHVKIMQTYT